MNLPLHWKRQIPNGLTMSRLVLTPGLLLWLWVDDARGFLLYGHGGVGHFFTGDGAV